MTLIPVLEQRLDEPRPLVGLGEVSGESGQPVGQHGDDPGHDDTWRGGEQCRVEGQNYRRWRNLPRISAMRRCARHRGADWRFEWPTNISPLALQPPRGAGGHDQDRQPFPMRPMISSRAMFTTALEQGELIGS